MQQGMLRDLGLNETGHVGHSSTASFGVTCSDLTEAHLRHLRFPSEGKNRTRLGQTGGGHCLLLNISYPLEALGKGAGRWAGAGDS